MFLRITKPVLTEIVALARLTLCKSTLPILETVRLDLSAEGSLTVLATDLDITIAGSFPIASAPAGQPLTFKPGRLVVPLDDLAKLAKSAGRDTSVLLELTTDRLGTPYCAASVSTASNTLVCHHIQTYTDESAHDVFDPPELLHPRHAFLPSAAVEHIREAAHFASSEETRYVLNGVCLDPAHTSVAATDGRHAFVASIPALRSLAAPSIVPTKAVKILSHPAFHSAIKLTTGVRPASDVDAASPHTLACFRAGRWSLFTKLIEGNYPNYRQIIPAPEGNTICLTEASAASLAELARTHLRDSSCKPHTIRLETEPPLLHATVFHAGATIASISIPAAVLGTVHPVTVHPRLLLATLDRGFLHLDVHSQTPELNLPGVLSSRLGDRLSVFMPMRESAEKIDTADAEPDPSEDPAEITADCQPEPVHA